MRKIAFITLSVLVFAGYSCKDAKKEKTETTTSIDAKKFSILEDSTKVSFTAYKTTAKVPVGGMFKKIKFTKTSPAETALEALNGTAFNIPVSSLFTNDATGTRDPKILEFFFGVLNDTEFISGNLKLANDKTFSLEITLNGETGSIPLAYTSVENKYTFTGSMDLKKWKALDAVASLNKVCEVLHTGADGVSKTWEEVALQAIVLLEEK